MRFASVGLAATLTTYLVLIILVEGLQLHAVPASIIGYLAGASLNYLLNYRFTFNSSRRHQKAIPRFIVVIAIGLALNASIMYECVNHFGINYLLAQLMAVGVVLLLSFTLNRLWAFSD